MTWCWCRSLALAGTLTLIGSVAGATDGPMDNAKALYAAASFEDALAALDRLDTTASTGTDALKYRALCLLALGRSKDAQSVTDVLVSTAPTFVPAADDDLSPRFVEVLNDTRRRLLPDIARRLFADGRDAFRARQFNAAKPLFDEVMVLAADDVWSNNIEKADLRTLASGFLDLVNANLNPNATAPQVTTSTPSAASQPATLVAVAPLQSPDALSPSGKTTLRPPIAVQQAMPTWRPRDAVTAQRHFTGAVKIRIGTDGRVLNAAIEVATDPDYDKLVLEAARSWFYKPALRNGEPIEVEKLVTFSLKIF
jgi:TonB family protein